MRRYKPGYDEAEQRSPERVSEAYLLDVALNAMGSKFSFGFGQRLSTLDAAICAFVDGLRADDVGAAQVLISFKEHLADAVTVSADLDAFAVRRCIARYYER